MAHYPPPLITQIGRFLDINQEKKDKKNGGKMKKRTKKISKEKSKETIVGSRIILCSVRRISMLRSKNVSAPS